MQRLVSDTARTRVGDLFVYKPSDPSPQRVISYALAKATSSRLFLPIIKRELRLNSTKPLELNRTIDFAFRYIRPFQIREELRLLLDIVTKMGPKVILEIGTAEGGTLFLFARVADPTVDLVSIDIPSGEFGGGYPRWRIPLYESFAGPKQRVHLLQRNSHQRDTLELVMDILGERKVDFMLIDGDHTYEGAKRDFEMYSPLVRDGGIIALHDIVQRPLDPRCEVNKLWSEIKETHQTLEIIEDEKQTWGGVGVVRQVRRGT